MADCEDSPTVTNKPRKRRSRTKANERKRREEKRIKLASHTTGPDCKCIRLKCFQVVDETNRGRLIESFNALPSKNAQDSFLAGLITVTEVSRPRPRSDEPKSSNHNSYHYKVFLKGDDGDPDSFTYVCFSAFLSLFGIKKGRLEAIKKSLATTESPLRVIRDGKEREEIVSGAHAGFGNSEESKALGGHLGFDKTEEKIASKVWWPSIRKYVRNYIKACDPCQRRAPRIQKGSELLHPVEIPPHPWSQIGVDICSMPTSKEGYTCMVIAVDYFSKWIEAEALHRKTAEGVANFLYNCICRHGCFDIQINDRGREFVNSISTELHRLTGEKQKVTSPYHPQVNGLVERSNRTIQDMMMKLISDASLVNDWPKALPGILFALRTSKHASTKYSPFFLMYGREPKLPVELTGQQFPASKTEADSECAYSEQQYPSDKTQTETETECAYSVQQ